MAITSPFKKHSHSRDSSREEQQGSLPRLSQQNSLGRNVHKRNSSGPSKPLQKSNTVNSVRSQSSVNSIALAQQYEQDKNRLIKYCFSNYDSDNILIDSYITHVRIIEDSAYPSFKPPSNSPSSNKKKRILALAVKRDGEVFLHKGRENPNGSFQVGRVWSLSELSSLERELRSDTGLLARLGKDYYWETSTTKERQVFVTSLVRVYRKFKNGLVPQLINWDLSLFGLDANSYEIFLNKEIRDVKNRKASVVSTEAKRPQQLPKAAESSASLATIKQSNKNNPESSQESFAQFKNSRRSTATERTEVSHVIKSTEKSSEKGFANKGLMDAANDLETRNATSSRQTKSSISSAVPAVLPPQTKNDAPSNVPAISSHQAKTDFAPVPVAPSHPARNELSSASSPLRSAAKLTGGTAVGATGAALALATPSAPAPTSTRTAATNRVIDSSVERPLRPAKESSSSAKVRELENETRKRESLDPKLSIHEPTKIEQVAHPEPIVVNSDTESVDFEADIDQKMKDLGLYDISNDSTNVLNRVDTLASNGQFLAPDTISSSSIQTKPLSVSETIKEIDIVAHRRSYIEFEKEQEEEEAAEDESSDDITELYHSNAYDVEDDLNEVSQDFSYEHSYEQDQPSHDRVITTPQRAEESIQSDDDYDSINDGLAKDNLFEVKTRSKRSKTIDSALDKTINETRESSLDDIFDNIEWDPNDDAETLTFKLMQELADTEYDTIKQLIDINDSSAGLKDHTRNIVSECQKIGPVLTFFSVELAGLSHDIQHVEYQGKGLQVETINKKNLWNELTTILDTVAVDEKSLKFLLRSDIDRDLSQVENILSDLQSAMRAVRGSSDNTEEHIGDMRALRERRTKYENVIDKFLRKTYSELDYKFDNTFGELAQSSDFSRLSIEKSLSELMAYSSLTLFTKDISGNLFESLIGSWEKYSGTFYQNLLEESKNRILKSTHQREKFTLASAGAFVDILSSTLDKQNKTQNGKGKQTVSSPSDKKSLSQFFETLDALKDHAILQQNFLSRFFHLTQGESLVSKYSETHPLESRQQLLNSSVDEIETDRQTARELYNSNFAIFQPALDSLIKSLVHAVRFNQKNTPAIIAYLEIFEKRYSSSNQEFLLSNFKKLSDRLKVDWLRFIEIEIKTINKSVLNSKKIKEVSTIVQNFTQLVKLTEENLATTISSYGAGSSNDYETRDIINSSYSQLANAILKNLKSEDEEKISRFQLHDETEDEEQNLLVNLIQNINWIVESLSPLKVDSLVPALEASKKVNKNSRDQYISILIDENFGKIARFVSDVEDLRQSSSKNLDPSKRNAYSKATLSKILSGIDGKEINKIVIKLREVIKRHFSSSNNSEIQHQLIDQIWSATQGQFMSITLGLENIVQRYYRDVELHFGKKDIIASFNSARSY